MPVVFGIDLATDLEMDLRIPEAEPLLGSLAVEWRYEAGNSLDLQHDRQITLGPPHRFDYPRGVSFEVSKSDSEVVVFAPQSERRYAEVMLVSHVVPFVARLRGNLVLHAATVEIEGGQVLIVGPSGAGKSTISMRLSHEGAAFLSDDVSVIVKSGDGYSVLPGPQECRLWEDMASVVQPGEEFDSVYPGTPKKRVSAEFSRKPAHDSKLKHVVLLRQDSESKVQRVRRREVVISLMHNVRDGDQMPIFQHELDMITALSAETQGYQASRPLAESEQPNFANILRASLLDS